MAILTSYDTFATQRAVDDQLDQLARTHQITSGQVVMNPYGRAPLAAVWCFHTDVPAQYVVSVGDRRWMSEKTKVHRVPIIGLEPGVENRIRLYDPEGVVAETVISAPPLPSSLALMQHLRESQKLPVDEASTYYLTLFADGTHWPILYDQRGSCCGYFTEHLSYFVRPLSNGHFITGAPQNPAPPYGSTALWEMDLLGRIYQELRLPKGVSNDAIVLPDGHLVAITGGDNGTVMDHLAWVNTKNGAISQVLDCRQHLSAGDITPVQSGTDWCHLTQLYYDEAENLIWAVAENASSLLAIDAATAEVHHIYSNQNGLPLSTPGGVCGGDESIWVLDGNRFAGASSNRAPALIAVDGLNGEHRLIWQGSEQSPVLNRLVSLAEGAIVVMGGCSESGRGPGIFDRLEHPERKLWTVCTFLDKDGYDVQSVCFPAAAYGLFPLHESVLSCSGTVHGVVGYWASPIKIDVPLPVEATELVPEDMHLHFDFRDGVFYMSAQFFQGEATALLLENESSEEVVLEKSQQVYIQNNRQPYGAPWLMSKTAGPERVVRWRIPLQELKGRYHLYLWVDGIRYDTQQSIDCVQQA